MHFEDKRSALNIVECPGKGESSVMWLDRLVGGVGFYWEQGLLVAGEGVTRRGSMLFETCKVDNISLLLDSGNLS